MKKFFDIPLPGHLLRFAEAEIFNGKQAPFKITESSAIGKFVLSTLIDRRSPAHQRESEDFEDILSVELSDTLAKRSPSLLKLRRIRIFIQDYFHASLRTWVVAQQDLGANRYQAVLAFLKYYGIDDSQYIWTAYLYVKRIQNFPYKLLRDEKKKSGK